ncbi:bifunctional pyr operon transcriptional regulator/uracil phosphoribosyltransferase PyrR [Rhodoferax sp.]|uniref:bifunctional pyr operon transcriptional regulator/uracil phosphoribosyltransferase PyrR n=1 Tax=Rhodoferax sp. TaxID=50421 RepID=UPI0026373BEF|nr:bifunctional pyr operon transcriptional regulator/uracil phosphoribosyltransferase PyrR [Rhodoferax sp.]MDD2809898.1 bifunctional pyr operon transcriptional regulator/uracil phosphoribosyltransferase PyrR [Rhodoferax sp.]
MSSLAEPGTAAGALVLDAEALYADLLHSLRPFITPHTHLLGVASGGVWLAERLHADLALSQPFGVISSAMHRDDYARRGMTASTQATRIDFDVNGAQVLLLDDVLFTGRTIRAVLNELFDFGRPASVKLAVLVDRGGRELPLAADVCAARITLPASQSLALARSANGQFSFNVKDI